MRARRVLSVAMVVVACGTVDYPGGGQGASEDATGAGDATGTGDTTAGGGELPGKPVLQLEVAPIKRFELRWRAVEGAEHYELLESPAPGEPFATVAEDIHGSSISLVVPLHLRHEASYRLRACNAHGCTDAADVTVEGSLVEAMGHLSASNAGERDELGGAVALSRDGSTLVVGAPEEDSEATGVDGDQTNDAAGGSGAAYVFVRDAEGQWSQQAYLKASNPDFQDAFGNSNAIALSGDGSVLAIGANAEESGAAGIDGDQADDTVPSAGAVYVFVRDAANQWSQQAYVKASNPGSWDDFGSSVALSGDGTILAVGASRDDSDATGIDGDQTNDAAPGSGAVYVFERGADGAWSQRAYVKASNTGRGDNFGHDVELSRDGDVLAVAAHLEQGGATGIDGDQANGSTWNAGAAYVFVRDAAGQWSQQAYVKASNTDEGDTFGTSIALSGDGETLAVGGFDDSAATGIYGNAYDDSSSEVGAVHVFVRDASGQWSQQAYIKASNAGAHDRFGHSVALGADGAVLAVGAIEEDGNAAGIDGDQADESLRDAGAAYVFVRDAAGWSQRTYLKASNPGMEDSFGQSIALSDDGEILAVGANQADAGMGAVYLY